MAIVFSGVSQAFGTSSNILTVNKPVSLAVGDLLIGYVGKLNNDAVTIPSGFTQIRSTFNANNLQIVSFYKVATSGDVAASSFDVSWTNACRCFAMLERASGAAVISPIETSTGGTINNTIDPSFSISVTPTIPNSALYAIQIANNYDFQINGGDFAIQNDNITFGLASSTWDSSLNSSAARGVRPQTTATGDLTVTGGAGTSDWAAQLLVINPFDLPDPGVLYTFSITDENGNSLTSESMDIPFTIKITALDYYGDIVTSFVGTVDISSDIFNLVDGGGQTGSFVAGVYYRSITIGNAGIDRIDVINHSGSETGSSDSITVLPIYNIQQHEGDIYYPVKLFPTLSTVKHINVFMAPALPINNDLVGTMTDISFIEGRFGQAAYFNGSTSNIITTNTLSLTNDCTFSCWIKTTSTSDNSYFGISNNDNSITISLGIGETGSTGQVNFFVRDSDGVSGDPISIDQFNDNLWHHIVGVKEGNTTSLYIDGNLIASTTQTFTGNFNDLSIYIGPHPISPAQYSGGLDECLLFDRALTESEISALYQNDYINSLAETDSRDNLIAYYPLDGSSEDNHGYDYTRKEAAIKIYLNQSINWTFKKYITQKDIRKGYVSYEINKPFINSIQIEVEYFNADNPNPEGLWSNIGVIDFCPSYADVEYEPTTTIR